MPIPRNSSLIAGLLALLLALAHAHAQEEDPAGLFLQAYQQYKGAERLEAEGKLDEALAKYRSCVQLLDNLQQKHADYEPVVIDYRLKKSRESVARIESLRHAEPLPDLPTDENLEGPLPGRDEPSYIKESRDREPLGPGAGRGFSFPGSGSYRIPVSTDRAPRRVPVAPQRSPAHAPSAAAPGASSGNGLGLAQQEEIRALRSKLNAAERRAAELDEKLHETMAREQSALREVDKTKVALVEVRAQLNQVRQTLDNVETDNKRLTTQKSADHERITELESELETARADLEVAEDYNSELFAKLERAAGYIEKSDAIRKQLQTERNTLKQRLDDGASEEIKLLAAGKQALARERDEALAKNKELRGRLEEAAALKDENQAMESKLQSAEKKVADLVQAHDSLSLENQRLLAGNAETLTKLDELREQKDQVGEKLEAARKTAEKFGAKNPALETKVAGLEAELERATSALVKEQDSRRAEADRSDQEKAALAKQLADARKNRDELAAESEAVRKKLDWISKEEEGLREQLAAAKAEAMKLATANPELQRTIRSLEEQVARAESQRVEQAGEATRLAAEKAGLFENLRSVTSDRDALRAAVDEARKREAELSGEKEDLLVQMKRMRAEAEGQSEANPELQRKIDELGIRLTETEGRLARERESAAAGTKAFEAEKDVLSGKLIGAQETAQALAGRESGREKLVAGLKARLQEAETKSEALLTQLPERDKLIADLRQELGSVRSKLAAMREGVDSGQARIADLEKQLEETSTAAASVTGAMADENALLKAIVTRELQEQARRQQARKLVEEEMEKLQIRSEALIGKLNALGSAEVALSEKERKLFEKPLVSSSVEGGKNSMNISMVVEKQPSEAESKTTRENDLPAGLIERAAKANALANEGGLDQANAIYEELVAEAPESYFAKVNLGVTQLKLARHAKAIETLEGALAIRPGDAFALMNLGIAQYRFGRYGEAARALGAAVDASPKQYFPHYFLGLALNEGGDTKGAVRELLSAIEINPEYAQAHLNLAIIYATAQPPEKERARQHYKRALELGAPGDASLEQLIQ